MAVKNYVTSISVNNTTRNKLIALSNIYEVTQKDLLSSLVDKEIAQLSSKDKSNFAFILKAIEIKDSFRKIIKSEVITMNKKHGNIGVSMDVQNKVKALARVSDYKFIRSYIEDLIDKQVKNLSSGEYEDYRSFLRHIEQQEKQNKDKQKNK